jgi:hypothetical protein
MSTRVSSDSPQRWEQLNRTTRTDASAQEIKECIEKTAERVECGSSEGVPDPMTHENVETPYGESGGRGGRGDPQ